MSAINPRYRPMGDRSLLVELGDDINLEVNRQVRCFYLSMKTRQMKGIVDLMPGYRSLLVVFDPLTLSSDTLRKRIADLIDTMDPAELPEP